MSLLPQKLSTTVGLELEFNLRNHDPSSWDSPDLPDVRSPANWIAKDEHCGIELVTEHTYRSGLTLEKGVERLLKWANKHTAGTTKNCGIHVHLGMQKRLGGNVSQQYHWCSEERRMPKDYLRFLLGNERFFFYLVPPYRAMGYNPSWLEDTTRVLKREFGIRTTSYNQSDWPAWLRNAGQESAGVNNSGAARSYSDFLQHEEEVAEEICNDRQWFTGVTHHKTIEYRLLQGTYDHDTIIGWVALLNLIHSKALDKTLPAAPLIQITDTREQVLHKVVSSLNPHRELKNWIENQYASNDFRHIARAN